MSRCFGCSVEMSDRFALRVPGLLFVSRVRMEKAPAFEVRGPVTPTVVGLNARLESASSRLIGLAVDIRGWYAENVRYETTLSRFGNNTGIEVPTSVLEELGGGRRPAVSVVVNGYAFDSTVGAMGGLALIPFSAQRRRESGLSGGDVITVDIELDDRPREVVVPPDLTAALDVAARRAAFDALAPSARKAHVAKIESAKAADTRARRIAALIADLA